jgi:hypothetical protein
MAAIIRASHPISFNLLNSEGHSVLGIFDEKTGQTSTLEIINKSRRNLQLKDLKVTKATAEKHHFELKFRPGTLNTITSAQITADAGTAGWDLLQKTTADGCTSFYLLSTKPGVFQSGAIMSVRLHKLNADGAGGARGTKVELKWREGSFEYVADGSAAEDRDLVAGHRVKHLDIINERGEKYIPLHVGFAGTNQVLNDGTPHESTLRITNTLKPGQGNISLIPPGHAVHSATQFIFSFENSNKEWTLGSVSGIKIESRETGKQFTTRPDMQATPPVWVLSPDRLTILEPGQYVDIKIKDIATTQQAGPTNLYLHYRNIPGYWDGDFVSVIEKTPVVYMQNKVGVGTDKPQAALHVNGELRVDKDATVDKVRAVKEVSTPKLLLDANGEIKCGADHQIMANAKDLLVKGTGKVTFSLSSSDGRSGKIVMSPGVSDVHNPDKALRVQGGLRVDNEVSIGGGHVFQIDGPESYGGRLQVETNGNIGIGTPNPGGWINSGNYFKADKEGRIVQIHSTTHESVLILSTDQDKDGAHLGGIYFTRTKGQADAHHEVAAIKCRQMFDAKTAGGILQFYTKPAGGGANSPAMVIRENGRVGIGTDNPRKAALEVAAAAKSTPENGYFYMNYRGELKKEPRTDLVLDYSIWAHHRIAGDEFNAISDERIKNVQGRSDGAADLCTLLGIEITDYNFRDAIARGDGNYKKVIGQQVEKVFPQAVHKATDVVPDIFQQASIRDGWVALATDLKKGDRVKLITEKDEGVHEVLEVSEDKFRVAFAHEDDEVFVYGREVNDFLTVDYDAISMLNVSATQQLKKNMDQEIASLRVENAELRAANESLARRLELLENKLNAALGVMAATNGSNGNGRH